MITHSCYIWLVRHNMIRSLFVLICTLLQTPAVQTSNISRWRAENRSAFLWHLCRQFTLPGMNKSLKLTTIQLFTEGDVNIQSLKWIIVLEYTIREHSKNKPDKITSQITFCLDLFVFISGLFPQSWDIVRASRDSKTIKLHHLKRFTCSIC